MYRVMIVDDEQLVLDSFSHVIHSHARDFEVAGTCISGEEAIVKMPSLKPHVVFMDVNMPGLNGIDVIRHIGERYPETLFILATAYERFDIARQVIPLNVLGYLVEPITRPKLLAELDRVVATLRKRESLGRLPSGQEQESTVHELVARLLSGEPAGEEWLRFARKRGLGEGELALALIEPRSESFGDWDRLCRYFEYKLQCATVRIGPRLLVLIADSAENRNSDLGHFLRGACSESCIYAFEDFLPLPQLPDAYRRLLTALGHADLRSLTESGCIEMYVRSLVKCPPETREERFIEIWTEIFSHHEFVRARGMMIALLSLYIHLTGMGQRMVPGAEIAPAAEISALADIPAWEAWAEGAGRRLFAELGAQGGGSLPATLRKAVGILHEQHAADLQLPDLARSCGVSATHLSRLFSAKLGLGFVDYLNRYRVGIAAKLLREGGLSIKEISAAVGFSDPNYFSRVFKRWRGVRPSDFASEEL